MSTENFALYNLVMSTVDFSKCETYQDSVREFYRGVYPYLRQQLLIINTMKGLLKEHDLMDDKRLDIFKDYMDVFETAEKRLLKDKDVLQRKIRTRIGVESSVRSAVSESKFVPTD